MLHISCWDVFKGPEGASIDSPTLTRRFREVLPNDFPLISTGSIWTSDDVRFVMNEGADLVGVGRVGIGQPNWAKMASEIKYITKKPQYSREYLKKMKLSNPFIDYMSLWKNFVTNKQ